MSKKYILILGAGLMQRPALEAAKELGYLTAVVDGNPQALCAAYADVFEPVDLKDREGILEYAKSFGEKLAGVFTCGTDFSASVSYVCENLGFTAHSFESALNASNKIRMRTCFESSGVSSPRFIELDSESAAAVISEKKYESYEYPKVMKPVDNMGARGCRIIRCAEEFVSAFEVAEKCSRSGKVILEDYMEGPEFSIDSVVYNGTLTVTGFADRHIFYPPYFIEMGHSMPTSVGESEYNALLKTFAEGIASLGLTCGVAKADIKFTNKGPMIGEIAARLSGGYMSGWTYPYASGINLTKQAMLIALGKEPSELVGKRKKLSISDAPFEIFDATCSSYSAERAWISIPGKIKSIYGKEKAEFTPFVKNVFFRCREGDEVDFPRNNVEKCGNVISLAPDRELSFEASDSAVSFIVNRLEPNNKNTDKFLENYEEPDEKGFLRDAFVLEEKIREELFRQADSLVLEKDSRVSEKVPDVLESLSGCRDWNHRTIMQTLELFDEICPEHKVLEGKTFWKNLVRGGIQGILYMADCQ